MLNTWQEFTAGGRPQGGTIPEDLRNFIENVSPIDRPALALLRRTKVNTAFIEWLEDTLEDRGHNAYPEGADFSDQANTVPSRTFTHVQTFARWGKLSDEQREVEHRGFEDAMLYQEGKKVNATLNDIEHAIHRGSAATGATNASRQTAGFLNVISTNFTDASGLTLTEDVWGDVVQLFKDGGRVKPSVAFVNSFLKRTISGFSTKITRNVDAAAKVQYLVIERHVSDFGDINIYHSRDQLKGTKTGNGNSLTVIDPAFFETGWLRPLMVETLARGGLNTKFQISAMMCLLYRTEKAGACGTGYVPYIPTS